MAENANIHLKLVGKSGTEINGESEHVDFAGQIEIEDWKWNLGTEQTNGKPEPSKFSFKKRMCRASTIMLKAMAAGEPLTATVVIQDTFKGKRARPTFELKLIMTKVLIVNYSLDMDIGDKGGHVDEDWDFDYDKIRIDYRSILHGGTMTVEYVRPAGSTLKDNDRSEQQIMKLAAGMGREDLKRLWEKLKLMAESDKFGKKPEVSASEGVKGGKPGGSN